MFFKKVSRSSRFKGAKGDTPGKERRLAATYLLSDVPVSVYEC